MFAVFAGVDAVHKFAVGNSLAKRAFVESPKFRFETLLLKRQNNGLLFSGGSVEGLDPDAAYSSRGGGNDGEFDFALRVGLAWHRDFGGQLHDEAAYGVVAFAVENDVQSFADFFGVRPAIAFHAAVGVLVQDVARSNVEHRANDLLGDVNGSDHAGDGAVFVDGEGEFGALLPEVPYDNVGA